MEMYRKQIDKKILEQLKNKIQNYLKRKKFDNEGLVRNNLDKVAGLYVENLKEKKNIMMESRGSKNEIAIDKRFFNLDENDNPIAINEEYKKLVFTQLTHELIHSGARFDGKTGILAGANNKSNVGLNEGMTQMFTEKIWGYTLSPNTDNKYKGFKKVAKILDTTFGENVSLDAYFNHTNALENSCNTLANDNNFYSDINKYLSSIYNMSKNVPKENTDKYYQTIVQPIQEKMMKKIYDKVCAEIIIPKLKTLSAEERRNICTKCIKFS